MRYDDDQDERIAEIGDDWADDALRGVEIVALTEELKIALRETRKQVRALERQVTRRDEIIATLHEIIDRNVGVDP